MDDRFYLLKIRLLYIEPPIWRRIAVPADITLHDLHKAIQHFMGWEDQHLYEFQIGKKDFTESSMGMGEFNSERYSLIDVVKRKGTKFRYIYDFGDWWDHEIVVEDSRYSDPDLGSRPLLIDGARA